MNVSAPRPEGKVASVEVMPIIIGIMMAMFLAALDQTIVATALPTIGRALGDLEHLPWIVSSYLLASTAAAPLYGKLSDIHGRRIMLLSAVWIFLAGSVACALAPDMLTLILARALQGLGGGGLISLAQTIIADIVSPRERPRYQMHIASVFAASSLAGPILGGLFAEHLHWSLIFWINIPLGLVAIAMTSSRLKMLPRHERKHRLDYLGAVLMVAATVLFMLALTWGGVTYSWSSPEILGLLFGSLLLWIAFTARLLTAAEPFIPLSLFAYGVVRNATITSGLTMGTFIGLTIYAPIYLQTVVGLSAGTSGLALIPLMVGTVTGATLSGRNMARTKHYKILPCVGLAVSTVLLAGLALYPTMPLWALEIIFGLTSLGLGTVLPVVTVSLQNAVPLHQLGTATANMNFFRALGGSIMVAVFGAILFGGLSGGDTAELQSLDELVQAARTDVVADVFRWVFLAASIGFALALAFLLAMKTLPLRDTIAHAADGVIAD